MKLFGRMVLFVLSSILFAVFAQADVEIHIRNATTDVDDNLYETVGVENWNGALGLSSVYCVSCSHINRSFGYKFFQNGSMLTYTPVYEWLDIENSTLKLLSLGDDEVSSFISLGFTTSFYTDSAGVWLFDKVRVSSNGFVTFADSADHGCCYGQNLPDASTPNNLVAGWWEDLRPASGGGDGEIRFDFLGTSPNRKFVVQFDRVDHYGSNNKKVSFQIVFLEHN